VRNLSINKWEARNAAKRGGGEMNLLLSELEECIPATGNPEDEYESSLVVEAIDSFLGDMNKQARVVFVLRYFHGESIKGISLRLKLNENKIKSILFRARKKLGAYLEKEGIAI
jgi:RNA polymerase sigma-70 factor (ECF subfamily)